MRQEGKYDKARTSPFKPNRLLTPQRNNSKIRVMIIALGKGTKWVLPCASEKCKASNTSH